MYINHDMGDIWFGGPTLLRLISDKLSNLFWKEIIQTFSLISSDLHFAHPYFFYNFNIFDNPLFSINNSELNSTDFQLLWNRKIRQVGDYFDCTKSPPVFLSMEQINNKFGIKLNFLNIHRINQYYKILPNNEITKSMIAPSVTPNPQNCPSYIN